MKKNIPLILLTLFVATGLASQNAMAQKKDGKNSVPAGESRWSGVIVRSNKDVSTLTVRKGHIERIIHYDSSTRWTKGTTDTDPGNFKDGSRVICMGKYNEKKEFFATRIDLHEPHMMP